MASPEESVWPQPASPETFEDFVCDLFIAEWKDPNTHRYGRTGQAQNGVDIYGKPYYLGGRIGGVQCKRLYKTELTEAIIKEEIRKADNFKPSLAEYTFATTKSRDVNIENNILKISSERESQGKFPIRIKFWEDLQNILTSPENYHIVNKHYKRLGELVANQLQVTVEFQERNLTELRSERDKEQVRKTQNKLKEFVTRINSGYRESVRGEIDGLINDLPDEQRQNLSVEVEGQMYLIGACAYSPLYKDEDQASWRNYLNKARDYLEGEKLVQCDLQEALGIYQIQGVDAALAILDHVGHREADYLRFLFYLQKENFSDCVPILEKYGGINQQINDSQLNFSNSTEAPEPTQSRNHKPEQTKDQAENNNNWLRLLALYYGAVGQRPELYLTIDQLLEDDDQAAAYEMAAMALHSLGLYQFHYICRTHHICPIFHIDLGFAINTDTQALNDATEYLKELPAPTDKTVAIFNLYNA